MFIQLDETTRVNINHIVTATEHCPIGQADDDGCVYTIDDYCVSLDLVNGQRLTAYEQYAIDIWNRIK